MTGASRSADGSPGRRGQAYTLEATIGAVVLLTAVLFVTQAVVITPTTDGTIDGDAAARLHGEAGDVLLTAEHEGELTRLARYLDASSNETFAGDWDDDQGYDELPIDGLQDALSETFNESVRYNVEVAYRTADGERGTATMYFEGTPGDEGVIATHTVTLTDDMPLIGPGGEGATLGECAHARADCDPPIPDADPGGPVYNVVEVRVIVW